ncbi:MAG: hypothetical protein WC683_18695 [bacterium]
MARKPIVKAQPIKPPAPTMRGETRDCALSKVKPNTWNPNHMNAFMLKSFEQELRDTGWLRSMLILVWGKDEKGVERNIIIDGEHRHKVGRKVGYKTVPMTFIDGITEAEAKRLTLKIRKQGEYDVEDLSKLLQEPDVRAGMDLNAYALAIGIEDVELGRLLELPDVGPSGTQPGTVKRAPKVTLEFSTVENRDAFKTYLAKLSDGANLSAGDLLCNKLRLQGT